MGRFVFAVLVLVSLGARASDHIDGPVTIANQVADIIDLYAFQTPGTPRSMTLVLDVYPFVSSSGHFSDKVDYNFILRKAMPTPDGLALTTDASSEVVITCKFKTPQNVAGTQMICRTPDSRLIGQIGFNETRQPSVGNTMKVYGGRRADPFFLSVSVAGAYMKFQTAKPDGKNVMDNLNCLSVVLTFDVDKLFPSSVVAADTKARGVAQVPNYYIAVAAESMATDAPGAKPHRIDRVGRPEITNVTLNYKSDEGEVRDAYNQDRPYEVPEKNMSAYASRIQRNVTKYDMMDGRADWNLGQLSRLSTMLANDYLVLDMSVPCAKTSFFEIERELLQGLPHQSCGGRDLNDNVVNKLYTLYEKGTTQMNSISVNDGLKGPSKAVSTTFPYLAEPYDGAAAWAAEKFANLMKRVL